MTPVVQYKIEPFSLKKETRCNNTSKITTFVRKNPIGHSIFKELCDFFIGTEEISNGSIIL
jgi:hypothetical protein